MLMKGPKYGFLSNMYPCSVTWKDIIYKSSETIFQMEKCGDIEDKEMFLLLDGFEAKKFGRRVRLRGNWHDIKDDVMLEVLRAKFSDPILMQRLQDVKETIVEDNYWNDTYWGVCKGRGLNKLGILLEIVKGETNG